MESGQLVSGVSQHLFTLVWSWRKYHTFHLKGDHFEAQTCQCQRVRTLVRQWNVQVLGMCVSVHVCVEWASRGHRKARGNKGDVRACWTSWQQGQLEARSYLGSANWDRNLWNEMCLPLGFLRFESKTRKCCGALCKCHGRKGRRGLFHWSSLLLPS